MKKNDPYATPTLGRTKPERHFFHSLMQKYRHRSDTGLVEDRTSSVTIVRIIVGLLMLHLIIIGGVLLRGHMVKGGTVNAVPVTVTPVKTVEGRVAPTLAAEPVLTPPALTSGVPAQSAATAPAYAANHITQITDTVDEETAEEVEENEVAIAPAATAAPIYHMVATGDTWQNIAAQYAVSPTALQEANPGEAGAQPRVGANLVVPTGKAAARNIVPVTSSAPPVRSSPAVPVAAAGKDKVHVVQRGETLSRISRKVKVPIKELMEINGIKDANRISPGMKLRLIR